MMRIGLKFCGGCNPYYDRGAAVQGLKDRFPQHSFEAVARGEHYDRMLLICGCARGCVQHYREADADRTIVLKNMEEFRELSFDFPL